MDIYEGLVRAMDFPLAQAGTVIIEDNVPVAVPAPVIAGPQFFVALISGVILAFGFQMLLTNLSMAAGVSYVARSSNGGSASSADNSSGIGVKTIGVAFGLWTLVTVCVALFFACWLSIKLTAYANPLLGAITGLVIWATYFTLLVWFSSTTVGSLIGSVVKSATSGFQALVGTATAALGAKAASNEVVQTAEAAAAAVRRELTAGLDVGGLQDSLQDYIARLSSPEVDTAGIEREFQRLVDSVDFSNADSDTLSEVDERTFVELLSDRTPLSRAESRRLAKRLHRIWQENTGASSGLSDLIALVSSATGSDLASQGIGEQLDKLVSEMRKQRRQSGAQSYGPLQQALSQGLSSLMGIVVGKLDLSEVDANRLVAQIKSAQREILDGSGDFSSQLKSALSLEETNTLKADVESYLAHAYIGELKSDELGEIFRNVLYDTEADPSEMRQQLQSLNRKLFVHSLSARGMLTQAEINSIATRLEVVRQQVLTDVIAAETVTADKRVRQQCETFFKFTPASELTGDMGERAFRALLEEEPLEIAQLRERLSQLNAGYFRQFLDGRNDVDANAVASRYEQILQRVLADAEGVEAATRVRLQQQQQALEDYLRNTGKSELSPEGIKRDLQTLLEEPDQGIRRLRGRLAQFDRDTLVQLLSQRPEFSQGEVNQAIDTVEENWQAAMQAPSRLSAEAQLRYDRATQAIEDYLRGTGKPELSPEGIKRDLQKLMDNPKVGAKAIRYRLSKMDRDTLVQLLSQRDDLSEAEVNQAIDNLLSTFEQTVKAPRRLARRATAASKAKVASFQSALEDYLRNTNKAELNPDGIARDLKLLLNDPKLGASRLGDRLSQMDDSTMVALLAQRSDISQAEAEEIVGNIVQVRHQIKDQLRTLRLSVESAIARIFDRIRRYLQSLDRPELDYYGIKREVRTLFDDPQAGFSALRDRLSQFDRDTLVAIVSSHDRISEADANRVIDQIESARDSVLHKAERVEQQMESRLSAVKAQTQQQVAEAKHAAEAAAWWLFGTALLSGIVAAVGGLVAV